MTLSIGRLSGAEIRRVGRDRLRPRRPRAVRRQGARPQHRHRRPPDRLTAEVAPPRPSPSARSRIGAAATPPRPIGRFSRRTAVGGDRFHRHGRDGTAGRGGNPLPAWRRRRGAGPALIAAIRSIEQPLADLEPLGQPRLLRRHRGLDRLDVERIGAQRHQQRIELLPQGLAVLRAAIRPRPAAPCRSRGGRPAAARRRTAPCRYRPAPEPRQPSRSRPNRAPATRPTTTRFAVSDRTSASRRPRDTRRTGGTEAGVGVSPCSQSARQIERRHQVADGPVRCRSACRPACPARQSPATSRPPSRWPCRPPPASPAPSRARPRTRAAASRRAATAIATGTARLGIGEDPAPCSAGLGTGRCGRRQRTLPSHRRVSLHSPTPRADRPWPPPAHAFPARSDFRPPRPRCP